MNQKVFAFKKSWFLDNKTRQGLDRILFGGTPAQLQSYQQLIEHQAKIMFILFTSTPPQKLLQRLASHGTLNQKAQFPKGINRFCIKHPFLHISNDLFLQPCAEIPSHSFPFSPFWSRYRKILPSCNVLNIAGLTYKNHSNKDKVYQKWLFSTHIECFFAALWSKNLTKQPNTILPKI